MKLFPSLASNNIRWLHETPSKNVSKALIFLLLFFTHWVCFFTTRDRSTERLKMLLRRVGREFPTPAWVQPCVVKTQRDGAEIQMDVRHPPPPDPPIPLWNLKSENM